jgi:hypothetical protein
LAASSLQKVKLDEVMPIESVDGTQLTIILGFKKRGVDETEPKHFDVVLTSNGWLQIAGLTQPFCELGGGYYQWLIGGLSTPIGKIQLLLSESGDW